MSLKAGLGKNEWAAFVENCKSHFSFSPEKDGALVGAAKLATHAAPWQPAWERYCEAPKRYPHIPKQIRKCKMPELTLYSNAASHGGWPQWNEIQETGLRQQLLSLEKFPPHEARGKIPKLDKIHKERRSLVWSELGESPLAFALEHLTVLAEITANSLAVGEINDITAIYRTSGWRADDAVMKALAGVARDDDLEAVAAAVRTIYLPWMEEGARYLQKLADQAGYAGEPVEKYKPSENNAGECMLFVDGLRFDVAKRLSELLAGKGYLVNERALWTALPSVTATGKPAVTPVRHLISGREANSDFEPCVTQTGHSLKGGYHLRKLLTDAGFTFLEKHENGDGTGRGWCEFGDIDNEGHDHGWKLAKHVEPLLAEIVERVGQLLAAGWKSVKIVTDHGWLLLPGGLPKVDLPASLSENKWGRCAAIKPGAAVEERLYPWYWNPAKSFALADGVSCYRNGLEYAHGGLSLQECLTLELTITPVSGGLSSRMVEIIDVVWKGLRCTVAAEGEFSGLVLDIRTEPGNALSSIGVSTKPFKENGTATVIVEDESLAGSPATLVLMDQKGELVAQSETTVGGGSK
ncbi:MAG: BREX-1 system phosphatase PglZ type B [Syntrophobacteraceae bacterium]